MARRRRLTAGVLAVLLAASTAACSGGGSGKQASSDRDTKTTPPATVTVTPAEGTKKVAPDTPVQIDAAGGKLTSVVVKAGKKTVSGTYGTGNVSWKSSWGLKPGTAYTVTAVATNAQGAQTTATSHFSTNKAGSELEITDVTPNANETVGIGMPIMVTFNHDVADSDKDNVEKSLQIYSDTSVTGAWLWISDSEVIFRTQKYWPAHEKVKLVAHLTGVHGGTGLWGASDTTRAFKIGTSHITKVSLKSDMAKFYFDGKLKKKVAVSGGMGGYDSHGNNFYTTGGIHLTMGNYSTVIMTSPNIKEGEAGYYHETVYDDVQISSSGEYMHRSPGDFGCLGNSNCSHGCVRMTVAGAAWWVKTAYRGDPVIITGTPRQLDWENGWGFWQKSWKSWLKGSKAGAVQTVGTAPNTPSAAPSTPATGPSQAPGSPAGSASAAPSTAALTTSGSPQG